MLRRHPRPRPGPAGPRPTSRRPTSSSPWATTSWSTAPANGTPMSIRRSSTSISPRPRWMSITCRRWRSSPTSGKALELLEGMTSCNKKDLYVAHLRQELVETFEREGLVDSWPVRPQRVLYAVRKVLGRRRYRDQRRRARTRLWIAKFYPVYGNNTLLISNGLASMGFALPAAIGAKLVHPRKEGGGRVRRRRFPHECSGAGDSLPPRPQRGHCRL